MYYLINIYSVMCARYLKYFICINSFDGHYNTVIKVLLSSPFCRRGNIGAEMLSHLAKITVFVKGRDEI